MASSNILADFSKRPPGVKIGVFFLVLALVGAAWYQLFYSKLRSDLAAAKKSAEDLTAQTAKVAKDEAEYKRLDAEQKKLKKIIEDNDAALPTAAQLPAFFDMLNRKLGEAGVEVRKWDYQKEVPVEETIFKVPVVIEIAGNFYQLEKFFYLLYKVNQKEGDEAPGAAPPPDTQERDRILTVEDLHISDPVVKNGDLVLTATFRASTFRKQEVAPPETPDKAKPGAKPAPGAKPGGGGLTGAPAKAKAKTSEAMDKDEQRANGGASDTGADRVKGGM